MTTSEIERRLQGIEANQQTASSELGRVNTRLSAVEVSLSNIATSVTQIAVRLDQKIDKGRTSIVPAMVKRMPRWAQILIPVAASAAAAYFGIDIGGGP